MATGDTFVLHELVSAERKMSMKRFAVPRAGGASGMNHTDQSFDTSRRLLERLRQVRDSPSEGIM